MIDCEGRLLVVQTPCRRDLVIYGEGTWVGLAFCSAARPRQYIQDGCMSYLAYVVDTRAGKEVLVYDVPIVREFDDEFPKELPGRM